MQQQARDEAGNIWEIDAQGNPVRLIQAAGPAPMTIGTPNPVKAYDVPKAQIDIAKGQADLAAAGRDAANAPTQAAILRAQQQKAELDAEKARRDLQAQQATASPEQQARMAALANDEVLSAIQKARDGVNAGGSAGYWARLGKVPLIGGLIEPQGVIDLEGSLNTIASRLTLDKLAQLKQASPTGASGLGSLTEREGALLRDSVSALGQTQSPEKLLDSLAAVEKHYRNYMALTAGQDYRDPKVAERYGIAAAPETVQRQGLAQGEYREEADPALAGVNSRIRSMIGAGRSAGEIVAYMNSVRPGLGDEKAADVAAAATFRAQNPSVPLSRYAISVENRSVPMSGTRQLVNAAAQSPFGAYMMSAGDAISAGTFDNFQDNPALARAGMAEVARQNPVSSIAGLLSGGALSGALAEGAVAGRLGATWAPRAADALYGAAYGAGSADEGSRLEGAAWGATGGVLGGEGGRRAMRAVGSGLRGVQNESAQYLRERGVPLTIGQILGGAAKAREDTLAGFRGVGDRIGALRREGVRAFNEVAINEGLQPVAQQGVNQTGEQAIDTARGLISGPGGAYDRALNGVTLVPDQPFTNEVAAALARGGGLARVGPEFTSFVDNSIAPHFSAPNGQIDGRQVQDVLQQVRGANFGTDSMGLLATDAARGIEGAVMDLADRQAPGAMEALGNANTAYRNLNILADAVGRGVNQEGLFMPSQLAAAARANTNKFGGRIAAATPDRPFFELARAGQDVLPSRVPDSGTAGRQEANGGITAAVRSAVRNISRAPLYADATQEPIARLLMDRTPEMIRAGEVADQLSRIAGLLARPASLAYGPVAVSDY